MLLSQGGRLKRLWAARMTDGVEVFAALALGLAGDTVEATRLAGDLAQHYPKHTKMQSVYLPTIHAVVALQRKDCDKAIKALAEAAPYELGTAMPPSAPLSPVYIRGVAYLGAHQAASGVIEFQKILNHPGVVGNNIIGALSRLQLGRAYTMSGDTAKARAAYQDFLTLWKDADPDIPILKQAKAEYAKLQ